MSEPYVFPAHALLVVEERLREQRAEGVRLPDGVPLDELALRILVAAEIEQRRRRLRGFHVMLTWTQSHKQASGPAPARERGPSGDQPGGL
jgi:hypothetical protein